MQDAKFDCLCDMGRAVMANHGGKPDAYDWQSVFANVNIDKIWSDKQKVFDCVTRRVDALLHKEDKHHG